MVIQNINIVEKSSEKKILPLFALFWVPILYGSFYIITKLTNENIPIYWMIALRMSFALIGFIPFIKKVSKIDKQTIGLAFILSLVDFLGLIAQTIGLQHIDAGKAGFISGLFIILTPILSWIFYRTNFSKDLLFPIFLILIGLFVMFYDISMNFLNMGIGELLNFIGAISISLHIIFTAKFIKEINIFTLTMFQIFFMLVFSVLMGLITWQEYSFSIITIKEWLFLAYLGVITATLVFILQNWGQKFISDTTAAIIISIEPVFATFFGCIIGNEIINLQLIIGGLIIICGFILTIFISKKSEQQYT